jgi:pantothenate kinase-related protein Tda10
MTTQQIVFYIALFEKLDIILIRGYATDKPFIYTWQQKQTKFPKVLSQKSQSDRKCKKYQAHAPYPLAFSVIK